MTARREATSSAQVLKPGTLWQRIQQVTTQALGCGALLPIETCQHSADDQGCQFLIRLVTNQASKPLGRDDHNPFLPYEETLFVGDVSTSHACVLNKYCVVPRHLLIITRHFEDQETALSVPDFQAWWRCLSEFDSLGFYNSGRLAGASQRHKHLQLVPLERGGNGRAGGQTIVQLLDQATCAPQRPTRLSQLPFVHAFVRWRPGGLAGDAAERAWEHYRQLAAAVHLQLPDQESSLVETPYNLLVTDRWMLLVPRRQECFQQISLNALAFAGALLAQNEAQLRLLRHSGIWQALRAVAQV